VQRRATLGILGLLAACAGESSQSARNEEVPAEMPACVSLDMETAFATISRARSWPAIQQARRCAIDDGAYSELFDEAIAITFLERSESIRELLESSVDDPDLLSFVLDHLSSGAMSPAQMKEIHLLALNGCPLKASALCTQLLGALGSQNGQP